MIRLDGVGVWSELLLSVYGVFVLLVTLAGGSICFGGSGVAVWWFFVFPNSCFCCNRTIGGFFIEFC